MKTTEDTFFGQLQLQYFSGLLYIGELIDLYLLSEIEITLRSQF